MKVLKEVKIDKNRLKRSVLYTLTAVVASLIFLLVSFKVFSKFYKVWFMESNSDYTMLMICTSKPVPLSEFKRGDFVGFYYQGKDFPQYRLTKGKFVIKQIWGFPGDLLRIDEKYNKVYINGELKGAILKTDRFGNPVEHFHYNGRIPQGKIFVMAPHPRSFDSRYYGFVEVKQLYKCWALF